MKKVISTLLAIMMLFSVISMAEITAFAATSGDFEYQILDDGTAEITKYKGSATNLTIPSKIGNYTVTSIGDGAFQLCKTLTSIIIPDSVTRMGDEAFYFCDSLTSIKIPNGVTSIGYQTFYNCKALTRVEIPNSVTDIGYRAFYFCESLTNITIPNNVTSIGDEAFAVCELLITITIPDSVISIGEDAFWLSGLKTIYGYIGSYAESYANENGYTFIALKYFEGSSNGVIVEAYDKNTLPKEAVLQVETVEMTDEKMVYDIALTVDGKEIQPNGEVSVKIPVSEGIDGLPYEVYREEEDGTLTSMNAIFQYGYLVFTTDHFSRYIVTLRSLANPGDVDGNGEIDDWDSVLLDRYLAGWDVDIDTSAADIDKSGDVDDWDSVLLARKLAGWEV